MNKAPGFTLLELLVVITILGLLAGLIAVRTLPLRDRARDARRAAELKTVDDALQSYANNNKEEYPLTDDEWWSDCAGNDPWIPNMIPTYIKILPTDPAQDCAIERTYKYRSDGPDYKLSVFPEDCDVPAYKILVDPAHPCDGNDPRWSYYTPGARDW